MSEKRNGPVLYCPVCMYVRPTYIETTTSERVEEKIYCKVCVRILNKSYQFVIQNPKSNPEPEPKLEQAPTCFYCSLPLGPNYIGRVQIVQDMDNQNVIIHHECVDVILQAYVADMRCRDIWATNMAQIIEQRKKEKQNATKETEHPRE